MEKFCNLCPHNCLVDRNKNVGRCKAGNYIEIGGYSLHFFEEPCISGKNGSGTVFFSKCNLSCVFCQNYEISNLDALILIEKPKMAPHIPTMKANISRILKCDPDRINIKATRGEKLGFVGKSEGAVSQCVVMLKKKGI